MELLKNLAVLPGEAGRTHLVELPMPSGPGLLVRMLRAPVNPADLLVIDGRYAFALDADEPIGAEAVGIVEAVTGEISDLSIGDLVLPLSRGNWCRYRIMQRSDLIALPKGIDLSQAAMLRINPLTARLLIEAAGAVSGDLIVQNAASSAVARWVRVIAAQMNIAIIDVVRRADSALPDAIVDGPDLAARVHAVAQGRPVRAALDCVAGPASGRMAECLAPGGRLIVFGHLSGESINVRSPLLTGGQLSIQGFSLRLAEAALGAERRARMFGELLALFTTARLHQAVRTIMPLSRIDAAVALARSAGRGRVLLDLSA